MASAALPQTDVAGITRPAGRLDLTTALEPYRGPWNARLAAHLLRRAGFGGTSDEVARTAAMPMNAAVDSLVNFPSTANLPEPDNLYNFGQAVQQLFPGGRPKAVDDMQRRQVFMEIQKGERASIVALQQWWLNRMLTTPAPLQEKMTLYFHGHFTTAAIQKGVDPQMAFDQNQLFRQYALGNLRNLTWQVSIDPAMLIYLDNATNLAQHPNENYARELMELFTLGVDHYTENDVREAARAWSGWIVNRLTGQARYVPRRHDDGSKTFLGQTGNFSGQNIVEIIYQQPACAEFWANNLLNFFVYNSPEPQLVSAVAALIRASDFNLQPVMSTLLRSNVFYSPRAYRALVKSPVEFVVGTYKTLGLNEIDERAQRALVQMGQILFYPPNVAGWPGGANWLTSQTVISRENFVASLVNSPMMDDASWMNDMPLNARLAASQLVSTILHGDASPSGLAQLADYLNGAGTSALGMLSGENYPERVRGAAYLTMAMPAYQLN
ncbi:MAG TPA: DUF1800 domain-containing protein [Candidatus Baltobacteraceae bacterium]|nr:DUF1800 domain-containing protein [Candidatus Baltobacteraceae bacterium]